MTKMRHHRPLLILFVFALLLGSVMIAWAAPSSSVGPTLVGPTSVGLLSFSATVVQNTVQLNWEVATELSTAGYIIKRSVNGGPFISLPDIGIPGFTDAAGNPAGFITGEGGPAEGFSYQEMDDTVQSGNSYTYKLIEIENNFNEVELAVQTVTLGATPTNTPTATATQLTNTAQPTSTPLSTATGTQSAATATAATATAATATATTAVAVAATATVIRAPISAATPTLPTPLTAVSQTNNEEGNDNTVVSGEVVLAQDEGTATAVPPPPTPETINNNSEYPASQNQEEQTIIPSLPSPTPITLEETAYPVATLPVTQDGAEPDVSVIGSQTSNPEDNNAADSSQASQSRQARLGRIYLWSGFLLALLIFITTIAATILLFTRKRTQ